MTGSRAALAGEPDARERYLFRAGRGELPPNDWQQSVFGGPAWTRVEDGSWYRTCSPRPADLNWMHPDVRAEFENVLGFWFDKGVDGFRIDVAHGHGEAAGLPDRGVITDGVQHNQAHPAWDQDGVHRSTAGGVRWRIVMRRADLHRRGVGSEQRATRPVSPPR